ncbi:MAG: DUF4115 domain-containing protein [Anaerolineales bacterium]|nr:DUF4115 domain-containing protein [Anaerolineales bacterium]
METLGKKLRDTRERLGLTLDEAERATRIRIHHLEAIERGEIDALPSPVQARGFLHNYSEFLGLNPDDVLLEYAEWLQSKRKRSGVLFAPKEPVTQPTVQVQSRRPRWLSSDLFFAAAVTIAIITILVWGGGQLVESLREDESSTQDVSGLLIPTVTSSSPLTEIPTEEANLETVVAPPTVEEATSTPPPISGPISQINLQLVIEMPSWVKVLVDGEESYQDRAVSGDVLEFQGEEVIEVMTGNGAGVRVIFNGQDQGPMGELGQVVIRLWTLDGMITPTPTLTHTPTQVPTGTDTPMPTPGPISSDAQPTKPAEG